MSWHIDYERVLLTESSKLASSAFYEKMKALRERIKPVCSESLCAKCGTAIDRKSGVELWNASWRSRDEINIKGKRVMGSLSFLGSYGPIDEKDASAYVEYGTFEPGLILCRDCFDKYISQYEKSKQNRQNEMKRTESKQKYLALCRRVLPLLISGIIVIAFSMFSHPIIGVVIAVVAAITIIAKCKKAERKCAYSISSLKNEINREYNFEGLLDNSYISQKLSEYGLVYDGVGRRRDVVEDWRREQKVLMGCEQKMSWESLRFR